MTVLRLRACAKLNLLLRVVGRRPDGYHLIETLFHQIDLCDELWAEHIDGPCTLTVTATDSRPRVALGEDNLVLRACRAFCAAVGTGVGVRCHLHKAVPTGAGLGGGSSDAAAALRLCQALTGAPLPEARLRELARGLGADVPFFLDGGSQWGRGVGDQLEPASQVQARYFLLLVPPFACDTAAVYRNYAAHLNPAEIAASIPHVTFPRNEDSGVPSRWVNDLETAAERVQPELANLRARVAGLGFRHLRMTGSGSTLFLSFDGQAERDAALGRLRQLGEPGSGLIPARTEPALPQVEPSSWSVAAIAGDSAKGKES